MRSIITALGVLAIAIPTMASPISLSENWDGYLTGNDNRTVSPYVDNWQTITGYSDRQVITASKYVSTPNCIQLDNGSSYGTPMGISHDLGGVYAATAANPIVVTWSMYISSNAARKSTNFYVELAMDDVSGGTLAAGEAHDAVGMAQSYTVRGGSGNAKGQVYGGNTWTETVAPLASAWKTVTMTITDTTVQVSYEGVGSGSTARTYLGNFDQINIRHGAKVDVADAAGFMDNLTVSGGVWVSPEPASLVLLGSGLLFVRRRRA